MKLGVAYCAMDPLNIIKIITAIITVALALIVGINVLFLNPDNLLNKWFSLFFFSVTGGFLTYTIYHLITTNAKVIIPLMITSQILYNIIFISLVMTVFVLEKFEDVAMSFRYLGTMIVMLIVMSFGYFIWIPELNMEDYEDGIVNTITPKQLFIFVNFIRIALAIYVIYKYGMMTRKVQEETKKRIQWLFSAMFIVIVGLLLNLLGGLFGSIFVEIFAMIAFDFGIIALFKAFLIR
ncbi:MAG: hypothetical protein ACFFC3_06330 [Candidatus Odinarchaeota archaeon]